MKNKKGSELVGHWPKAQLLSRKCKHQSVVDDIINPSKFYWFFFFFFFLLWILIHAFALSHLLSFTQTQIFIYDLKHNFQIYHLVFFFIFPSLSYDSHYFLSLSLSLPFTTQVVSCFEFLSFFFFFSIIHFQEFILFCLV